MRLDVARPPRRHRAADGRAPRRRPLRRPARAHRRGHRAGRAGGLRRSAGRDRGAGRGRSSEIALPHAEHGLAAYYVLAPPRRAPTWPATTACATASGPATATRCRSTRTRAPRGFGDEVKRRIMLGTYALSSGYYEAYYGRAQRVQDEDRRGLRERVRARRPGRHAHVARPSRSGSASAPTTRSRCTSRTTARSRCRWPGSRRSRCPGGFSEGLPVGVQLAGPAFSEQRILEAAHALELALDLGGEPLACLSRSPSAATSR